MFAQGFHVKKKGIHYTKPLGVGPETKLRCTLPGSPLWGHHFHPSYASGCPSAPPAAPPIIILILVIRFLQYF